MTKLHARTGENRYTTREFIYPDETKYGFIATRIEVVEGRNGKAILYNCVVTLKTDIGDHVSIHNTSPIGGYLRKLKKMLKGLDTAIDAVNEFNLLPTDLPSKPKTTNGVHASRGYQAFLNPLDSSSGGTIKTIVVCKYLERRDGDGNTVFVPEIEGTFDLADCTRKLRMLFSIDDTTLVIIRDAIRAHHDKLVTLSKTTLGRKFVLEPK